jgi:nucleoside 2-deoxyribosyltransferase
MRPKIFIASPLFNAAQIAIIAQIEAMLAGHGYDYYSARLHSGSDKLTPEQRRDIRCWDPVFDSNEAGLDECRVCIAVLEYPLPYGQEMGVLRRLGQDEQWTSPTPSVFLSTDVAEHLEGRGMHHPYAYTRLELPDAGTVWETGYMRAQGKIVVGFHSDKAKHLNLMLSHGCDGLIRGFENLEGFLAHGASRVPTRLLQRKNLNPMTRNDAALFDWRHVEDFDAATKDVE